MIIGIGCDISALSRYKKNHEALAKKILTKKEMEVYLSYANNEHRQIEYLAGRFAAKEAIVKALDVKKMVSEIEVLNDRDGKPYCHIEGYQIHISIAHESEYAQAYALCEK